MVDSQKCGGNSSKKHVLENGWEYQLKFILGFSNAQLQCVSQKSNIIPDLDIWVFCCCREIE